MSRTVPRDVLAVSFPPFIIVGILAHTHSKLQAGAPGVKGMSWKKGSNVNNECRFKLANSPQQRRISSVAMP